ncbi:orotidine 5'-phosphate decarboxylase / HUMPS family protein [Acrocarpospora catenulata]|uniref:orotidine 5'-phosphate decarboxylase / HUMPS family protein n=1 Tax=Acrocarpospora catenulata TaxID=2836182 RepID=UPI001BDB6B54|nr:orotidine 5'-phosphate decarboxylase / HUMPS family protein [Acrocarpospora catenulata]
MELQVALDRMTLDRAVDLAGLVAPYADWIEVGTSLIKRYGTAAISAVVDAAGHAPVVADTKTADDAATELHMCFAAGAKAVTVLGMTTDATVRACAAITADLSAELLVDLLAVPPPRRTHLLAVIGQAPHVLWAPHVGVDARQERVAGVLGPWARGLRVAVAGGLTAADVAALTPEWPHLRCVVGGAITSAPDPLAAVVQMKAAMRPAEGKS